jgi:streptomycin 3"-adenylyltransferase
MHPSVGVLLEHLDRRDPGGVRAVSLFGSSALGGLRPDSDLDVLVLTERSLAASERQELLDVCLRHSGRRATVRPGRPLELTSVVLSDVVPWSYPPTCDYLYGEWLRDDLVGGRVPERHRNPDLAVVITTARQHAVVLRGPSPVELLAAVPPDDLRRAMLDGLEPLLADLLGDERNVLLTLARMVVTLATGQIMPKDHAVEGALVALPAAHRPVLALAARAYRGEEPDDWTQRRQEALAAADALATHIRAHG